MARSRIEARVRATGIVVVVAWALGLSGCAPLAPRVDHHQHVFSAQVAALVSTPERPFAALRAADVVAELDRAGIERAVLLSVAYLYAAPGRTVDDVAAKVRDENDWTVAQAALYPTRLVALCGFNPLADHALAELERCAAAPGLDRGIKLHFGNSDVRLDDAAHVDQLKRVFAAANARGMAIAVHFRASISRQRPYGAAQVRVFLERVMPMAPDVPVQIAHFAGSGPGFDDAPAQQAMAEFAAAVQRREPAARRLWFDVASIVDADLAPATAELLAGFIRQVGADRVLFGSDAAVGTNLRPREAWAAFRRLPLTREELATIAGNVAPYLR